MRKSNRNGVANTDVASVGEIVTTSVDGFRRVAGAGAVVERFQRSMST